LINTGLQALKWKLREKRDNRGLRGVAKEIGITHTTLHSLERGHINPTINTFLKVCKWLNINPGEVLEEILNAKTP